MTKTRGVELDPLDVRLLQCLQQDADRPTEMLGRLLGISASSVQRRIRALKARGVIERTVAIVRPERVGRKLFLLVDVTLEREDLATVNEFKRAMRSTPEVVECYHVTGDHTFMLLVNLRDMEEFAAFAARVFGENRGVKRFVTSAVMARVKSGPAIPLDLDE